MEKVRKEIQERCLNMYNALSIDERLALMDYSGEICKKYNLGPWYRETTSAKTGKVCRNRFTTNVKISIKGGNINTIQMFLECYNYIKGTNHTIKMV